MRKWKKYTLACVSLLDARALHGLTVGVDTEPLVAPEEKEAVTVVTPRPRTQSELPTHDNTTHGAYQDNLFDVSVPGIWLTWLKILNLEQIHINKSNKYNLIFSHTLFSQNTLLV